MSAERKCFIQPCDRKPTKLVILETSTMTIKMPMCAEHAASEAASSVPVGAGDPE